MILQATDYTPGQAGWMFNGTAATFAGEGHGDAHWETEARALTVTGTHNCARLLFYKGKSSVTVTALDADGNELWGQSTPDANAGDFSIHLPAIPGAVRARVTVHAFPARSMSGRVFAAGVVNVQVS